MPLAVINYRCTAVIREHLGVEMDDQSVDVSDPICTKFYKNTWLRQASINTNVYEKVSSNSVSLCS